MKIKHIVKIPPKPSRCIEVENSSKLFALKNGIITHNSVSQQNIIISCLLRPEHWVILGIDLKRVELSRYRKFGMKVATELGVAIEFLRFAQSVMMKRYEVMEGYEINDFTELPEKQQALMVMIDEAGELLSPTGSKTDEGKADDEAKAEAQMIIGSIARLGRAAGVHLVIATQRPDAKLIPGEVRDNLAVRIGCGNLKYGASQMMFNSNIGQMIRSKPAGGMYIEIHSNGNMGQGFFAPKDWLENYYKTINFDPSQKSNGLENMPSEKSTKAKQHNALEDWDEDMDSIHALTDS